MSIVLSPEDVLGLAVGYLVGSFLHVVVHELGHLAAGLLLVMRVCGVRIAGMTIGRRSRGAARTTYANAVFAEPRPGSRLLQLRSVMFLLAGPAANLCGAIVTFDLVSWVDLGDPVRHGLYGATTAGVALCLSSLVPFTTSRGPNDGRRVLALLGLRRFPVEIPALRMAEQSHSSGVGLDRGPWRDEGSAMSYLLPSPHRRVPMTMRR